MSVEELTGIGRIDCKVVNKLNLGARRDGSIRWMYYCNLGDTGKGKIELNEEYHVLQISHPNTVKDDFPDFYESLRVIYVDAEENFILFEKPQGSMLEI